MRVPKRQLVSQPTSEPVNRTVGLGAMTHCGDPVSHAERSIKKHARERLRIPISVLCGPFLADSPTGGGGGGRTESRTRGPAARG